MSTQPPPTALTEATAKAVADRLAGPPSVAKLESALRYLSKWRAELVANSLIRQNGAQVLAGPFAGMAYPVRAAEGSRSARLLGAYEAALHPVIDRIITSAPDLVIDIGSAEGYYAVGLARRLPQARILARDADPQAQELCRTLAAANGVEGRVEVGGLFTHADFDLCTTTRAVVICDIEGAEAELLDPARAPGLAHADILVECHPAAAPGVTALLKTRFGPTHKITEIGRKIDDSALPDWMEALSDLDRLLALWEWRGGPTPWLWMQRL